jgi:hypothetical protein
MNNSIRVAVGVAAVAVGAFLGYQVLFAPNVGVPGPSPSPEPTATSEPTATPEPTPGPDSFESHPGGTLIPGSYVMSDVEPFEITFTVPPGWEKLAIPASVWSVEDDKSSIGFTTIDDLRSDPCDPSQGNVGVGPTADDLVTALADVPGYALNSSEDTSISGYSGTMLDITWSDPGCPEGVEGELVVSQPSDVVSPHPGETEGNTWYVLDVDGERLVISVLIHPNAVQQRIDDIQAILDSVQIE